MQRYEITIQQPWNTHATEHGEWVKFTDAKATIARLTAERDSQYEMNAELIVKLAATEAERDEAMASAAAAYEMAANHCWQKRDLLADAEKKQVEAGLTGRDYYGRRLEAELLSRSIRALATEAETTALAEIVKKAVDAETQACIVIVGAAPDDEVRIYGTTYIQDRLNARIDQRKEPNP